MSDKKSAKKTKPGISEIAADTLTNKFFIVSLITLLAVLVCSYTAEGDMLSRVLHDLWEILLANVCMASAIISVNIALVKSGISRKTISDTLRKLDPKLTGAVSDYSGVGSLISALAAVVYALSNMFVSDTGGLYSDELVIYVVLIVARALTVGCMLSLLTSADELHQMIFLTVSRMSGAEGEKLCTNAAKLSHSPKIMGALRRNIFIGMSVQIGVSAMCIICAFTMSALPFPISAFGLLFPMLTVISAGVPSGTEIETGPEKEKISQGGYSFLIVNTVMYVFMICMMLFSFPFRSVYTTYVATTDFTNEKVPPALKIFSLPDMTADSTPLFIAVFTVTVMFMVVQSLASSTYDTQTFLLKASVRGLASQGAVLLIMLGYCILYSIIIPQSAMNAVMWLVSVSIACLMLGINLIHILVVSAKSRTNGNGE